MIPFIDIKLISRLRIPKNREGRKQSGTLSFTAPQGMTNYLNSRAPRLRCTALLGTVKISVFRNLGHPAFQKKSFQSWSTLILAMAFCFLGRSQEQVTFRQISVKEGLSQNSAIDIEQDSTGYLWIATQDGLNRYDGQRFTTYPFTFLDVTTPDYSHLGKVYCDRNGRLWIVPLDGLPHVYDESDDQFEPLEDIDGVSVVYQSKDGTHWFGTFTKGLFLRKPKEKEIRLAISPLEVGGTIYAITEDPSGNVLVATDGKLIEWEPSTGKHAVIVPENLYGNAIKSNFSSVVFDHQGRQFTGTFGHGLLYTNGPAKVYHRISELGFTDPLPLDLNILDLHIDDRGRLWVATYGNGLYLVDFDTRRIVPFGVEKNNPRSLHYQDVLSIAEGYTGTLYFGTDGAGISYYDPFLEKFNSFTNLQVPEGINIDVVRAITVDPRGRVWIGTSGKGLTMYDPASNSWSTYKSDEADPKSLPSDRIMSLYIDKKGQLWIGTQGGGLAILGEDGRFKRYASKSEIFLSASTIWCIYEDSKGRIWLGSRDQGLIQFDEERGEVRKYTPNDNGPMGLPSNNIRVLAENREGNLWVGTDADGLALLDPAEGSFTHYHASGNPDGLSNNGIKALYQDPLGVLWIGTNGGGLNAFDAGRNKFHTYDTEDGLANNVIYAVLPDPAGNLWLSSNKGISKLTPGDSLSATPDIVNYANYDGLATEFNTGAYYKGPDGTLFFGGLEGFYWFRPDGMEESIILPKTTITELRVSDESRPLRQGLQLAYDQNTLSFSFSSMQYALPEKNRYQYRLINYDEEWVQAGNANTVRYAQLPPGDYEFQVLSSNYDGIWNPKPDSFAFSIAPPWYGSTLAKFVYGLLLIGALYWVYAYLKWRWRMRLKLQLQREEADRFRRLNEFKSKLYTDISHEFRNPLTLISGPVEAKLGEEGLSGTDRVKFSLIKRNADRLIALVDQLLHLAKLEKGDLRPRVANGNLNAFLHMLVSTFTYRASEKNIDYRYSIAEMSDAWYNEDALEKIVGNLLSNAFKYGREDGSCRFNASLADGQLDIHVQNTITPKTRVEPEKLFTRFYQEDQYGEGVGIGLALVKELTELYRGTVQVTVLENDTIDFQVLLPIRKEAFHESEIVEANYETNASEDTKDIVTTEEHDREIDDSGDERPIVLVVEDHQEVRDFLVSAWQSKYRMYSATDGREGIDQAMEIIPDLILSDVRMPLCDGIELCKTLKTDERTSHIPIILLTAGTGTEKELLGLQSGADDFVSKPFNIRVLEKKVGNLIAIRKALRKRYGQEITLEATDIALTPTDALFLQRVQKVLDGHLSDSDFTAQVFSHQVGMSRMQLHRKLLAITGLSTTAFIRSQRLKQAARILKTSDANINEVAYAVGFNTPSYFIKCFRETYQKTPLEYVQSSEK